MNGIRPVRIKFAIIAIIIAPLFVGVECPRCISRCDCIAQGGLVLLMIALPFCTPLHTGFAKQFALFFAVGAAWGMWRMVYFDSVAHSGVPGVDYAFLSLMMGAISALVFQVREWRDRRPSDKIS